MTDRQLWAVVTLASVALICVTVALALHVSPEALVSVISVLVVPAMAAILYGKVSKVEQQTNGANASQNLLISRMVEHLQSKDTVPPDKEANTHGGQ